MAAHPAFTGKSLPSLIIVGTLGIPILNNISLLSDEYLGKVLFLYSTNQPFIIPFFFLHMFCLFSICLIYHVLSLKTLLTTTSFKFSVFFIHIISYSDYSNIFIVLCRWLNNFNFLL